MRQPQTFNGLRKPLFNEFGALRRNAAEVRWGRRCRKHQRQRDHREADSGDTRRKQHVVHVRDIQAEEIEGYMLQRLDVLQDCQCKQQEEGRKRSEDDQSPIEATMEFLAGAASAAFRQMVLVILAHFWRDSGYVIPPACQDGANNSIGTLGSCHSVMTHSAMNR